MAELEKKEEDVVEEVSESETLARSQGWKPKEEFDGDTSKWVDYDEFNRRAELFDAIHKANQRAKKVEEQLNVLTEHHAKVAKMSYEKARQDLLNEKRQAAKENDLERVIEVDEQLEALEKPEVNTTPTSANPELEAFAARNRWYVEDEDLQVYANGVGAKLEKRES